MFRRLKKIAKHRNKQERAEIEKKLAEGNVAPVRIKAEDVKRVD